MDPAQLEWLIWALEWCKVTSLSIFALDDIGFRENTLAF